MSPHPHPVNMRPRFVTVGFFVVLWICGLSAHDTTTCSTPDVPANGFYERLQMQRSPRRKIEKSEKELFIPGDELIYNCDEGFFLFGNRTRKCMSDGSWDKWVPFCNPEIKVQRPRGRHSSIVDGNNKTCYNNTMKSGDKLEFALDRPAIVSSVRLFIGGNGKKAVRLSPEERGGRDGDRKEIECGNFQNHADSWRWEMITCNTDVRIDSISIADVSSNTNADRMTSICEMQVSVRSKDGCTSPPPFSVDNGHFKVWDQKADLICDEDYDTKNARVVCEGKKWKKSGQLKCNEILCNPNDGAANLEHRGKWAIINPREKISPGSQRQLQCNDGFVQTGGPVIVTCQNNREWSKTNATCTDAKQGKRVPEEQRKTILIAVVSVVVIVVLISLLALTIYLVRKQKSREVVVVFKPASDGSIPATSSETGYYESVHHGVYNPPLPTTPRPLGTPLCLEGYTIPEDSLKSEKYTMMTPTPADIAFGTLKSSELYYAN